jgi:hypothetical protein
MAMLTLILVIPFQIFAPRLFQLQTSQYLIRLSLCITSQPECSQARKIDGAITAKNVGTAGCKDTC